MGSRLFCQPMAEQQVLTAGLEETLDVNWNDYPYYSCHCIARRLQRHRRRTVLRHRILRRRRTRPCGRDPADLAIARKALRLTRTSNRHHPRKRVIQYAAPEMLNFRYFGILDTPLSRSMTSIFIIIISAYPAFRLRAFFLFVVFWCFLVD